MSLGLARYTDRSSYRVPSVELSYMLAPEPTNLRVCAKRRLACPVKFSTKNHTYTLLCNKDQDCMPPPTITDASGIWIRTFDYLQPLNGLAPCDRNTWTTLKVWGYTNVVPSLRVRPTLLSGHAVSNYLESTIIPGVRSLKFALHLPRRAARQLPPSSGSNFNRFCTGLSSRNNAGASKTSRTCSNLSGYIWQFL